MGLNLYGAEAQTMNLTIDETKNIIKSFRKLDQGTKGYITFNDLRKYCADEGLNINDELLRSTINSMDLNKNGEVDMAEFIHFVSGTKSGVVVNNSLKQVLKPSSIPVSRSGGGV